MSGSDEVVYLNNCELVLQSLAFKGRGTYYFVWKKGKKSTQSSKFQLTTDDPISPKEILALSLKVYQLNGAPLPRHTHLILFNGAGEQLGRTKLMIHEWGSQFKESTVVLAGASLKLRVKRRVIMRLEKFHRMRSEVEETSEDEPGRFLKRTSGKQGQNERDQFLRLTKQVQDQSFLIEKLREQRNSALIRNQNLQEQLSKVNDRMRKDLLKLRQYSQLRMQMRESVYKQQIQHLITSFNKNYQLNHGLLQGLIKEKYDYQREIEELKESNQEYMTHQQSNFERIISEMQEQKKLVDHELHDSNQKLREKSQMITELNDQLDALTAEVQHLRDTNRELDEEKTREFKEFQQQILERNVKIAEYEDIIQADKLNIKNITEENDHKDTEIVELNRLYQESLNQKTEISKLNLALNQEKQHLIAENTFINNEMLKLRQEIQDQNLQIAKLREQYEINTNELMKELQERALNFAKDLQSLRSENLLLHAEKEQVSNRAQILRLNIEQSIQREKNKEIEIELYKKQLESEKVMYEHLLKENADSLDNFKTHQGELNDKLTIYISKNTELEIQNTQIKGEIRQLTLKSNEEVERLRDEYQRMIESNRKVYDDQLDMLRTEREQESAQFEALKGEYQKQIQSMLDHHKNQLEQLDHLYKDEMENKTKEYVELMQRNSKLAEEYEDYKMKSELEKAKKVQAQVKRKSRMPKRWNADRIKEQDEQDEEQPIQTVEVQSQEEEQEPPLIIGKKLRKKRKEEPQQEQFTQLGDEEEEGQGELKGESIVGLYKQKHTKKSKLRKGKKISLKSLNQEDQIQEEEEEKPNQKQGIIQEEHSESAKKSSEIEEVEVFSQPQPQPEQKPKQKLKLQKKISKKPPVNQSTFTQEQFQQLKSQKEALSERVDALQTELNTLKKSEKKNKDKYQKDEKKYQGRIKDLEAEVEELNKEISELNASLGEKDSKMQESLKKQAEARKKQAAQAQRRESAREEEERRREEQNRKEPKKQREVKRQPKIQQEPSSPRSIRGKPKRQQSPKQKQQPEQRRIPSSPKQVVNQRKYLQKIDELQQIIHQKQRKIDRLDQQNKDLSRQMQRSIAQGLQRQQMLESKYLEAQRRQPQLQPQLQPFPIQMSGIDHSMKASLANLEERVSVQREKYQEAKLRLQSKSRECESYETELRKAKQRIEQLEERIKKQSVPRSIQELQSEIDDGNRKILELSRTVNQARLQRDSFQDETRILKKKLAQNAKATNEWQARASEGERELDDLRRKEQRSKREAEQWREQQKRLKQAHRRVLDELAEVRKGQSQFVIERKKVLDEVVRLEGVLAQKQTEAVRANKQLQKLRGKINEQTQGRTGKQRQLRTQFERLQIQRSKNERKVRQLQQTIKLLKQKLEVAQKQAKKSLQQRKQTYGEKLRRYIEEIMAVKQVVQQYQQENSHLKIQNTEFFEQNEILKMSYEKLQIKLEELTQHEETLRNQINSLQQKLANAEETIKKKTTEEEKTSALIVTIRKQLDNERVASRKKTQKLQSYEEINERYLYQIKNLKLKLNDFEVSADDAQKLSEQFYASQRTIDSLQEQLHKISQEYQQHSSKYVYTREEVEAALRDLRDHEQKMREEEVGRVVAQLDDAHAEARKNMQAELLALYAENQRLRVAMQKATQDAVEFQQQLGELQAVRQRGRGLEKERSMLERRAAQLADQLKTARQECRRLEVRFNQSVRSQEGKSTENALLIQKHDELNRRFRELTQSYNQLKIQDKRLLQKYKLTVQQKDETIEHLQNDAQAFSNKLLANQLQIRRLKQLEKLSTDDAIKKVRKLQAKIQEMTQTHQQSIREMQVKYKGQLKDLKITQKKYEEELEDKLHRVQELNEGVLMLQSEVEEITAELTSARAQLAEEGELYTIQINKLRNAMREMQQNYDANLRNLQEELSAMSKELTALKFSRQAGNSRLRGSRQSDPGDEKTARRLEEKIKLKDRRIEELKETVLALEQKLSVQVKIDGKAQVANGVESLRIKIIDIQREHKDIIDRKDSELGKIVEELKRVKEEVFKLKTRQEELTLVIEQKDFQISASAAELAMVSRLYNDLQREVEGRKENLNLQIKQQALLKMQLQTKMQEIASKTQLIAMLQSKNNQYQSILKKRNSENKSLIKEVEDLTKQKGDLLSQQRRKLQGESFAKLKLKQSQKELQSSRTENRKLRNELSLALKQSDTLKSDLIQKNAALADLLKQVQANDLKIEESQRLLSKYIALNELSLAQLKTSLEDLVPYCLQLRQGTHGHEEQLTALAEQHQELKFLYERKFLDLQEAKRENYELTLRMEQRQLNFQELQALHERVVWLQQENKDLAFREEAVRVQLEGLYAQGGSEAQIRRKIGEILQQRYV